MDKLYENIYAALDSHDYEAAEKYIEVLAHYDLEEAARLSVSLYIEQGDGQAALMAWERLYRLLPEDFYTRFLHARILFMEKHYVRAYRELQGMDVPADKIHGYGERIANLRGQCCRILGKSDEAANAYLEAAQLADEPRLKALEYSNYLFNLHYSSHHQADFLRRAAAGFSQALGQVERFVYDAQVMGEGPLRIGYISADFRRHVMLCFSYALLTAFNREKFAVYAYMLGPEDEYSRYLHGQVTVWRNLAGLSYPMAANIIHEDKIAILVDLAGHTKGNGLPILAYKPAPVQISGIGYFASTGLDLVDYFLGDQYLDGVDGEECQPEFTEELLVLPHSHFCYFPLENVPLPREIAFRRNGYVTFGSFNNFTKVNDEVLALWGEILDRVPESHLLLKAEVFDGGELEAYTRQRLMRAGLPMERVECRGLSADYLTEYGDMDIALDTFPYPGGGTSCDALYMGRPLITLKGERHGERFGYSLLLNLGLGELAAVSAEEYVERAVALAQDPELLVSLQTGIRRMMVQSPLMDSRLYMENLELAYEAIWQKQAVKLPQLTYRERIAEDKIVSLLIAALDKGDAEAAQSRLAQLRLRDARYYYLQSEVLSLQEKIAASDRCCRKALSMSPPQEKWLQGALFHRLAENARQWGERQTAAHYYWQSSRQKTIEQGKAADYSNYLFNLHYEGIPAGEMLKAAQGYNQLWKQIHPYEHVHHPVHQKLRIGYISPDFCRHVVAAFSQAFLRAYDRQKFTVYAYADCQPDDVTRQLMTYPVEWRKIAGMSPADKAELIQRDEVDILVDLSGHTSHSELPVLAYKPAPVQISGIGYFATTGLQTVDYFLTDVHAAPIGEEAYFTERLLRLPHSHLCYTPLLRPNAGKVSCPRNDGITLGTMNQFDKVTDEMLRIWGQIMQRLPQARLFLKSGAFDKPWRVVDAQERLERAGIPRERVTLQGYTSDYWQFYEQLDIALDTYPYPGGGSTCDALYMGVPVVSLYGQHHHERFGYSLLQNTGCSELAVRTAADYVECVVRLAQDKQQLQAVHDELARSFRQGAVMDEVGYMRDLENMYQQIWRRRS